MASEVKVIDNYINGAYVPASTGKYLDIRSPHTGEVFAKVCVSSKEDIDKAVQHAKVAFESWSAQTIKTRVQVLFRVRELIEKHKGELAELVMKEHGKNRAEALASIDKGNETVEYATSLPQLTQGKILEVSRGVTCQDRRDPLGIVGCIVPFNFPVMVPLWTIPIAVGMGNCVILKPSEKVPSTMNRVVQLFKEAGLPDGVLQIVNGTVDAVEAICDHPDIKGVTFVGSSKVAHIVATRCRALNKRALCLGGAKNHLVSYPDRNLAMTSNDIVASFSGCAGQRCMAASVLLLIGQQQDLIDQIVAKAGALKPGVEAGAVGPVIDDLAKDRITKYIDQAEKSGCKILLDGRHWSRHAHNSATSQQNGHHDGKANGGSSTLSDKEIERVSKGYWVGPTVILHTNPQDPAMTDEIFGPVLSIYVAANKDEAISIENKSAYGNAACIYTQNPSVASWFTSKFTSSMMGINIGIPVPREPFSFGGMGTSKYGDSDITGDGGVEFFSIRKKITSKWAPPQDQNWMS